MTRKTLKTNVETTYEADLDKLFENILDNLPRQCNYCDKFSGNLGILRNSEIGTCMNPKSPNYNKPVHEESSCVQFLNEIR